MRKIKLTPIWLAGLLAVSSCAQATYAQFCDVAPGPIQFNSPEAVPQMISLGEREALEKIDAGNRTGERLCGWVVQ